MRIRLDAIVFLNIANVLAGMMMAYGVYLEFGFSWALIGFGAYLAFNTISTIRTLNVRDQTQSS